MTTSGELNKRITLQAPTQVSDDMGGFTVTHTDMATVWAKKTTHRSNEAIQSMKETGIAIHNFRIRYRREVKASWRIKEGNQYMAIIGPPMEKDEGGGRYWLDITVSEAS